jgi:hypothetical protein
MTTPPETAGNPPPGQPPAPPESPAQPDLLAQIEAANKVATEWRNRFTGLQTTYQRDQARWKSDADKLAEVSEASAKLQEERGSLAASAAELQEKHDQMLTELTTLKAQQERQTILIKEFPQLLSLEADGLLPDDTGDELRAKLKKLSDKLVALNKDAFKESLSGASPTPPAPKGEEKPEDILARAMQAYREGKFPEYDQAYSDYLKAIK